MALVALRRQLEGAHAHLLPDYFRVPGAPALDWPIFDRTSVILLAEEENSETPAASGGARAPVWGYVSVKLVETPADPAMTPCRRAHIDAVVVDAARRGGGIGTALMRAAATWARRQEAAELVLTVWSDNEAAEALYRRLGYRPIARVLRHVLES
ncbi:MAG: GNAT family N-acetyltransferase [Pseudomonadota bacterium]